MEFWPQARRERLKGVQSVTTSDNLTPLKMFKN